MTEALIAIVAYIAFVAIVIRCLRANGATPTHRKLPTACVLRWRAITGWMNCARTHNVRTFRPGRLTGRS